MSGCMCTGACRRTGICHVHSGRMYDTYGEGLPIIPPRDPMPQRPADGAVAICGLCGLRVMPVMGYVCSNPRCGVFPQVTCAT